MNTSADAVTAGDAAVASVSDLTVCVEMSEPFEDDEELIDCPDDSDASPANVTLSSLLEMCTDETASEALMTQLEDRATLDESESAGESAEEARHSKMEQIKEAVGSVPQKNAHVSNGKERMGKVISKDRMELEKRTPEANVNELSRNTRRVAGAGAPLAVPPFAAHRGTLQGHSSSAESPEREKRPEGLPFPFENLPGCIRRALNDKKPIPRAERRALVRCVVEELTEACPRPTRELFQEAAMAIVKAFPDALADRRPDGKLRGKGYSSFCEQLKARANYLALRRRTISPATPWGCTSSTYSAECFSFHLEYVPNFVQKALKARRPLPQRERRDLVRCVAEQLTTMSDRPQRNLIRQAAMDVVRAFPDALLDRNLDGRLLGTGYDSFFQQLESLIENVASQRVKRTVVSTAQQLQQSCGRRAAKDLYGCVNWQPATNSDPPEEVDERIQFLKREAKKGPKEIDARRCSDYMEEMYPEQRSFINADPPPSISAVKDQWPMLFHRPFFYNHGNKLLAKDVKAIFDQKVSTYAPPLVRYMETITRTDVIYILLAMEKGTKKGNANAQEEAMLPLLCSYFREDERHLYRVLEEGTDIAEILPELPSTPTIVALGSIFQRKCFVTCEQQILFTEPVDFSEATCLLLLSYYVFNLAYPDPVAATLEFLQRETFSINPLRGSKYENGRRSSTSVSSKIMQLLHRLR
uniref:Protein synganglion overexpressed n=1 Tax=Rhipicephalus microplus TaxID=6941 RepID=A0A6M2D3D7_RHIMP